MAGPAGTGFMQRGFTAIAILCAGLPALFACVPQDHGWAAAYKPNQSPKIAVTVPANARSITQEFLDAGSGAKHEGIDITGPIGTPVIAAADGVVLESFYEPTYGNRIVVDHGTDGAGRHWVTVYKHLKERLATAGTPVARGQKIATLGATGALAGGLPHLHFELRRGATSTAVAIDPHRYWVGGIGQVTCYAPGMQLTPGQFRITYPVACAGTAAAQTPVAGEPVPAEVQAGG